MPDYIKLTFKKPFSGLELESLLNDLKNKHASFKNLQFMYKTTDETFKCILNLENILEIFKSGNHWEYTITKGGSFKGHWARYYILSLLMNQRPDIKIAKEDLENYNEHLQCIKDYHKTHPKAPSLFKMLRGKI